MDAKDVARTLDQAMPNAQVICDIQATLQAEATDGIVQIELDEQSVSVPTDVEIILVTKAFIKEYQGEPFGV